MALNCQYPPFVHDTVTLGWDLRCPMLADLIVASEASVVCAQEIGTKQLADMLDQLGPDWHGCKSTGLNGNGLNAVLWHNDWTMTKVELDQPLPSFGQMQRTLVVCRLTHTAGVSVLAGSFHTAAAASDLTKAEANVAKLAQVKVICDLTQNDDHVVLGGDLARADDSDDLAYFKDHGWTVNGRNAATPQVVLTKGVTAGASKNLDSGKGADHPAVLTLITTV